MRIVVPIHSLEPGGVERVALGLAAEWQRAGHKVTVVLGRSGSPQLVSAPPLDFWQIPTRRSTAAYETPWMVHCLYSHLLENRADVLFCPGNTYAVVGAAMRLLLGEYCPPIVLKVSNALERSDMTGWMKRGYAAWLRAQGGMFDRLVGLTEPMEREIRRTTRAAGDRIAVIANPILTRRQFQGLSAIERRPASPWKTGYLTAGRLVPQKNYPLLLRAFARAARPGDTLTIAGEGPERARLQRLATELGIADRVRFPGHLACLDRLFAEADVFVLSSDYEGLPGVIVEALAVGLPIVATDCCVSMGTLLGEGRQGILVPTRSVEALAAALEQARDFPVDAARSRELARRHLIEGAAAAYLTMMNDICATREEERRGRLQLDARRPGVLRRATF
jgi:glycosyltransferase involved in cell wall biosynthesis